MRNYYYGYLVRILRAGESTNGRIYTTEALNEVADLINRRVCVPVNLGHSRPALGIGGARIVGAEVHDDAVWGNLCGIKPQELVRMREGAEALGASCVGLSILAEGVVVPSGDKKIVRHVDVLESVDFCTRSTPEPGAGGMVPFTEHGLPVGWEERQGYWHLLEAAQEWRESVATHPTSQPARQVPLLDARSPLADVGNHIMESFERIGKTDVVVRSVYLDRAVVQKGSAFYQMPYRIGTNGGVDFTGDVTPVRRLFVPVAESVIEPVAHNWA